MKRKSKPDPLDILRTQAAASLWHEPNVGAAVQRLGFVQADPIRAPARAQDLILRLRVDGYVAGDLERAYPKCELEEDYIHVYGYVHRSTQALLHPRTVERHIDGEFPGLAEKILDFVRTNGETHNSDLELIFGNVRTRGDWGGSTKATTKILNLLHYRGLVRISRRRGNDRYFMVAPERTSQADDSARLRQLVSLLTRLYGPVSQPWLRHLVSMLGYGLPNVDGRRTILSQMVKSGELVTTTVDGVVYYTVADATFEREPDDEVRFLAPFDPIACDRTRFEHLYGWVYRFEAYTPPAKRKMGYYALPMLWHDHIVGWANVSVENGRASAAVGFVKNQPTDRGFSKALARECERMTAFLQARDDEDDNEDAAVTHTNTATTTKPTKGAKPRQTP